MTDARLAWLPATELAAMITKKKVSPVEVVDAVLDRIEKAYAWIPFTYPFNVTGQPAASVPCGFTKDGLPIGLRIVGRRFDDSTVLRASAAFERARPWAHLRPVLE